MRRFAILLMLFVSLGIDAAYAEAPKRVVTVNLCLDQLALRLAAPGQLVGVSMLSHDPRLSALAERARAVAPVRPTVESILTLAPDLVVLGEGSDGNLRHLLRRAGVQILDMPWATSLDDAETLIARLAAAMGREEAGRALVASMQAERRALAWTGAPGGRAVVLEGNRGTAGKGSLMDGLLRLAGLGNLAADLGLPSFARLSLEEVLAGRPDFLVFDGGSNAHPSRATEFVDHHAFKALAGRARIVSVPMKYALCAGPDNFETLRLLVEARK